MSVDAMAILYLLDVIHPHHFYNNLECGNILKQNNKSEQANSVTSPL